MPCFFDGRVAGSRIQDDAAAQCVAARAEADRAVRGGGRERLGAARGRLLTDVYIYIYISEVETG